MRDKPTLNEAEVDALFRGANLHTFEKRDRCDGCLALADDILSFGSDDDFEMPVDPGGALARELEILRRRHGRGCILLCYKCTDALQSPPWAHKPIFNLRSTRPTTPPVDQEARLFEP